MVVVNPPRRWREHDRSWLDEVDRSEEIHGRMTTLGLVNVIMWAIGISRYSRFVVADLYITALCVRNVSFDVRVSDRDLDFRETEETHQKLAAHMRRGCCTSGLDRMRASGFGISHLQRPHMV